MSVLYSIDNEVVYKWPVLIDMGLNDQIISAGSFCIKNLPSCEFSVRVGASGHRPRYLNIEVNKNYPDPANARIKIRVNNETKINSRIYGWEKIHTFNKICQLGIYESNNTYMKMNITCKIQWLGFINGINLPPVLNLHEFTKNYLMNKELSDITIAIGHHQLPAHKLILSQSPVFARMFQTNMKEASENRISISDIGVDVMMTVLEFLYSGQMPKNENVDLLLKVLNASEKYEIVTLKSSCEFSLSNNLKVTNVINIFQNANMYNAIKLRDNARKFIVDNMKNVMLQESFKEMYASSSDTLFDLFSEAINK